jgi:hypothetical protein
MDTFCIHTGTKAEYGICLGDKFGTLKDIPKFHDIFRRSIGIRESHEPDIYTT